MSIRRKATTVLGTRLGYSRDLEMEAPHAGSA